MLADPEPKGISTLFIFDEFHERHLYGDISLARALTLQETARPDMKIVVMSATLDPHRNRRLPRPLHHPGVGRTGLPGGHRISEPRSEGRSSMGNCDGSRRDNFDRTDGDILVFMPGAYEIDRTIRELAGGSATGARSSRSTANFRLPSRTALSTARPRERSSFPRMSRKHL